jgi:HlyD family secretion protein
MKNVFKAIFRHKIISAIVILLIVVGGYFGYKTLKNKGAGIQYVLAAVTKDTLIVSVSGSGQVSALDQVDIKPKVSGDIIYVGAENGQKIKSGALIAELDREEAQKAVDDAEIDLENAQISLTQAKENAESGIKKTYEDGFNEVTSVFLDLPNIMSGLKDILFGDDISGINGSWNMDLLISSTKSGDFNNPTNYVDNVYYKSYHEAKKSYEENFDDYKLTSRSSDKDVIKSLIDETYQTSGIVAEAVQNTSNLMQSYKKALTDQNLTVISTVSTYISDLNSYISKINSHLANLLSFKETIEASADSDPYGIRSKELSVEQKESALSDAKEKFAECSVYAPFGGIIAEVNVKKGDSVSTGTALATLITSEKIAEISLNEVDAANVKVGQKVTLIFDALSEVSISGKVLEVDSIGTASQGVVSYGVKISFDTQDERVKPGMSVTADIITDIKQDVLVLPNSAIKSQGNSKYVEFVEASDDIKQKLLASVSAISLPSSPKQQSIETGISNDTSTEIVSGLNEGDVVVTSTVSSSTSSNSSTTKSSQTQIRIPGVGGFEGGR